MLKAILLFAIGSSVLFSGEDTMEIQILKGKEVTGYIDDLVALRTSYFREYPYFYQVNPSEEKEYLTAYSNSLNTLFCCGGGKSSRHINWVSFDRVS